MIIYNTRCYTHQFFEDGHPGSVIRGTYSNKEAATFHAIHINELHENGCEHTKMFGDHNAYVEPIFVLDKFEISI